MIGHWTTIRNGLEHLIKAVRIEIKKHGLEHPFTQNTLHHLHVFYPKYVLASTPDPATAPSFNDWLLSQLDAEAKEIYLASQTDK